MKKHYTLSDCFLVLEVLFVLYGLLCFLDVNMNNISTGVLSTWNVLRCLFF